ncbi:HAD superfamily hydrolase [Lactobacillus plantarum JDM1] [Lactiplantibacillus mudanjiangensis]|uniref:HAD family hydrolase n=1 Tax=Lactiplantibacillus mudanjiangensis TaxID=1296538 RepID=UPI001014EDEB|nr:HAD superfamily hydrolase [Lactobacillus plantarum JDM1] [Lactiplantibacillus mudanjiangensis]
MPKYLVFMDIDGTLLTDHQYVSDYTKATIERLQQQDVLFYIATGRMYELAKLVRNKLNDNVRLVTSNGAVFDGKNGREETKLGGAAVELAYLIARRDNLPMMLFTPEMAYYTEQIPRFIARNAANFDATETTIGSEEIKSFTQLATIEDQITNGVILSREDMSRLDSAREKLVNSKLMRISSSNPNNLELIPLETDKGTAVKQIQLEQGVDAAHTFVFGDGLNDVGMMAEADLSVAMGNALPQVKSVANYETDTNYNDGLAKFLAQYFEEHPLS